MRERLLLTTWEPSAYVRLSGDELIMQLVGAALTHERVLIRDQDLAFNRRIAELFARPPLAETTLSRYRVYRALFEELIDTGYFQVVCTRRGDYRDHPEIEDLADRGFIITARAKFVFKRNLYVSSEDEPPFNPDEDPFADFHSWIDGVFRRNSSILIQQVTEGRAHVRVRRELAARLRRCQNDLSAKWGLGQTTAEELAGLVTNEDRAICLLRQHDPNARHYRRSPRRLVYGLAQTPRFIAEADAIKRLAQSVFAAANSSSLAADAIYNSRLPEPPREDRSPDRNVTLSDVALRGHSIVVSTGIGEALRAARALKGSPEGFLGNCSEIFREVYDRKRLSHSETVLGNVLEAYDKYDSKLIALVFLIVLATPGMGVNEVAQSFLEALHMGGLLALGASGVRRLTSYLQSNADRKSFDLALETAMDHRAQSVPLLCAPP